MTPKQAAFVMEYLVDLNATAAAVRAGYKGDPNTVGPRLLVNVGVQAAIAAAKAERSERTKIDADWVLRTLAEEKQADIADLFDDSGNLLPMKEWPKVWRTGPVVGLECFEEYAGRGDERVAVGMVRKVKLSDRTKHIELIGRHVDVQAFKDRSEVVVKSAEQELADLNAKRQKDGEAGAQ